MLLENVAFPAWKAGDVFATEEIAYNSHIADEQPKMALQAHVFRLLAIRARMRMYKKYRSQDA